MNLKYTAKKKHRRITILVNVNVEVLIVVEAVAAVVNAEAVIVAVVDPKPLIAKARVTSFAIDRGRLRK